MSDLGVTALTDINGNNSIAQSVIYSGTAKAWASVSAAYAEQNSFGYSSFMDNGTSSITHNYSVSFTDSNHVRSGVIRNIGSAIFNTDGETASSSTFRTHSHAGSAADYDHSAVISGDLA